MSKNLNSCMGPGIQCIQKDVFQVSTLISDGVFSMQLSNNMDEIRDKLCEEIGFLSLI